jgi:hypothetical protein
MSDPNDSVREASCRNGVLLTETLMASLCFLDRLLFTTPRNDREEVSSCY